ncbi:MAG TPA: hypothetical protein GXX25_01590 [Desulfotomaculum sp.]|nr:hypothetical protein [Desulfotomaculum sp.]
MEMEPLSYIPAGVLAAALSWVTNGLLIRFLGSRGVIYLSPGVEEGAKTGLALWFSASIPASHLVFGLVEGVWDAFKGRRGPAAGLVGVASHGLYGLLTWWLYRFTGNPWMAVAGACLVHVAWNRLVYHLSARC